MARLICVLAVIAFCSHASARRKNGSAGMETNRRELLRSRPTVLTVDGKKCKFPFRHGGKIHYSCISNTFSPKKWCATSHNYDHDIEWGHCASVDEIVIQDHCARKPCKNGGLCFNGHDHTSYHCRCPEEFTGRDCETAKCFDFVHYEYFDIGESWPRIHRGEVEQCTCINGQIECIRAARYADCSKNPCPTHTACRSLIPGQAVCACKGTHVGRHCNIDPNQKCYDRANATTYRGLEKKTHSGQACLRWNSDLLYHELRVDFVEKASELGLGSHSYCRSPDGDHLPWCYTLREQHVSWDYCNISTCKGITAARRITEEETVTTFAADIIPVVPTCGRKHEKRVINRGRILGGTSALPASHPWLAAVYIGTTVCGGSLIHPCWVVTAAHCFLERRKISSVRVVLGQHFFNRSTEVTQEFEMDRYILHEKFTIFNQIENDIALIKLKRQNNRCAKKTPFVQTICLPDNGISFPDGHMCEISGWGHMNEKATEYANHLQEALVPILPDNKCSSPEVYGSEITDNMFCAGYFDCRIDACQKAKKKSASQVKRGDSGGPLACESKKVSYLYGIISWGGGCGLKPGVYTRVTNYVNWINSKITPKKPAS